MQKESVYDQMTRSEKEVASYLRKLDIRWSYEHPIFVWDENKRPRVWAPDLCVQISLQMLAGESPAMVKPESHVAYTQCWK